MHGKKIGIETIVLSGSTQNRFARMPITLASVEIQHSPFWMNEFLAKATNVGCKSIDNQGRIQATDIVLSYGNTAQEAFEGVLVQLEQMYPSEFYPQP